MSQNENNSMKPKIRFKGFTDDWEQRKFGEVVDVRSGRDYKHLEEGSIPVFGTGGYMTSVSEALSYGEDAVGIGRKGTIDKPCLLRAPFWTVDTLFYSVPRDGFDLDFVFGTFLKVDWKSKDESTGLPSLSKEAINETELRTPLPSEQRCIGGFFSRLDHLITLHQRKYDKLVTLKKSMLEKMFPKEGETVPEVRFKGFTDPWEQRKLGEMATSLDTGRSVNSDEKRAHFDDVFVLKTSCVSLDTFAASERKRVVPEEKTLACCPVEAETIIVSRMNTPDRVGACGYVPDNHPNLFLPDRLWKLRLDKRFDTYLIYSILVLPAYKSRIKGMASGTSGSMHNIPQGPFLDLGIAVPSSRNEQVKIGALFKGLDHLITLHQRELDVLKNIKKSLLEKMFV